MHTFRTIALEAQPIIPTDLVQLALQVDEFKRLMAASEKIQ